MWLFQSLVLFIFIFFSVPLVGRGNVFAPVIYSPDRNSSSSELSRYFEPRVLMIPSLNLSLRVIPVGINDQGSMITPDNFMEVGWLFSSARVGEAGNLILAGHYDSPGGLPAAFFHLNTLRVGDEIIVQSIKSYRYLIGSVEEVSELDPQRYRVLGSSSNATVTLVTCAGSWSPVSGSYTKRLLIKGVYVGEQ